MEFIFNIGHEKSFFNNNIDSNKRPFPVTISMYISVSFMVDTYRPELSTTVQSCLEALLVCVYKNGQQTNQCGIGWFGLMRGKGRWDYSQRRFLAQHMQYCSVGTML